MRAGGVAALLALGVAVACGGRTHYLDQTDDAGGSSGAASRGGHTNAGGKASAGGKTSVAGTFSTAGTLNIDVGGTSSTLGGTSAGGSQNCLCDPTDECAPGYYHQPDPVLCCPGPCVLDCRDVDCTEIDLDCQPGMHVGTLPGECCPKCVPDVPVSCETAQELYQQFRSETFAKYGALDCSPRGCALAFESNRCSITCGTLVPAIGRDAIEEELELFAEATCSACEPPTKPKCLPKPPASCNVTGECTFDNPG